MVERTAPGMTTEDMSKGASHASSRQSPPRHRQSFRGSRSNLGFSAGWESDSLLAEVAFFARHHLHVDDVEISIDLQPGELLLFDNLAVAHGRRERKPGELRQRMFGQKLQPEAQRELRDRVLAAFHARQPQELSTASMP